MQSRHERRKLVECDQRQRADAANVSKQTNGGRPELPDKIDQRRTQPDVLGRVRLMGIWLHEDLQVGNVVSPVVLA